MNYIHLYLYTTITITITITITTNNNTIIMKVLAISSSIRPAAKSNQIVKMLQSVKGPKNVQIEAANIDLKLFRSECLPSQSNDDVAKLRHQLHESKAVLFVASELPMGFPYSVTAPLLNVCKSNHIYINIYNLSALCASEQHDHYCFL